MVAFDEGHAKQSAGVLVALASPASSQSMFVKQACHRLAAGGRPALHLAYWLGISLQGLPACDGLCWPHARVGPILFSMLVSSPTSGRFSLWIVWTPLGGQVKIRTNYHKKICTRKASILTRIEISWTKESTETFSICGACMAKAVKIPKLPSFGSECENTCLEVLLVP